MDAVIAGHICVDLTPGYPDGLFVDSLRDYLRPGSLLDVRGLTVSPGGAVANTGLGMAQMGIPVRLAARVGGDLLASLLRGSMRDSARGAAVELHLVEDAERSTSFSVILAVPGQDRIILHDTGANDAFGQRDLDEVLAGTGPRVFHLGYPPALRGMYAEGPGPLGDVLRRARAAGMTVSLDFSFPDPAGEAARADWSAILAEALPAVDLCSPSIEELSAMLDPPGFRVRAAAEPGSGSFFDPDYAWDLAGRVLDLGAAVCVVKLGAFGMVLRFSPHRSRLADTGRLKLAERLPRAGEGRFVPAFDAESIVSATGAGDSAIAGILASLLQGESLLDSLDTGCIAGRNAVSAVDAVSAAMPLQQLWQQRELARGPRSRRWLDGPTAVPDGWMVAPEPGLLMRS